jgi:cyclic-di-GMP-binding protein
MPSFDVVSEVDQQEVRNAIDQASRELSTRFDFKGTDTNIELNDLEITLRSATEDRLKAARQVLEEKLVKRKVSLKALDYGRVEEASGGTVR